MDSIREQRSVIDMSALLRAKPSTETISRQQVNTTIKTVPRPAAEGKVQLKLLYRRHLDSPSRSFRYQPYSGYGSGLIVSVAGVLLNIPITHSDALFGLNP